MSEALPRVLVVDDELFFREAIRDILSEAEFEVVLAADGEQALEQLDDGSIGVVVLDIRLPGIDGIEVLRNVREQRPDLRVIMLSAHTDQELVLDALRGGACDYLAKPLHDEELTLSVERAAEAFAVEDRWSALRTRLQRLAEHLSELAPALEDGSTSERESILWDGAVAAAADVLAARKASLLWLGEGDELVVVAAEGHGRDPSEMDPVKVGERLAGVAFQAGEPIVIRDIESDPRFSALASPDRYATGSAVLAPLESGARCVGVLCVADRHGDLGFGTEDAALMRLLALQIAELAADVARGPSEADALLMELDDDELDPSLGEDLDETLGGELAPPLSVDAVAGPASGDATDRDAEVARQICEAIASEAEPGRVLQSALEPIASELSAAPVSLYLFDPNRRALELEAECDGGMRSDRPLLPLGRGLTGTVIETAQIVAAPDPASDPRFDGDVDAPADGVAGPLLCLPLVLRGKVVGLVRAFREPGAEVSPRSGEVLAAALSAAVRNVLLYRSLVETIDEVAEARREARGQAEAGAPR